MTVLVVGATGMVGSQTVPRLLERGATVRCMTRSAEKAAALSEGAQGVVANLAEPETLPPAFNGVEAVFLIVTTGPEETTHALAALDAAQTAGVRKIVYLSLPMPEGSTHIPHFASKIPVEAALKASGMTYTILRPNSFFQNDLWVGQVITTYGVYPAPIGGVGLNCVDTRDIADAATQTLLEDGHAGQAYELHGPDTLTGAECAAVYSRHLGRAIHYGGDDLDAWAQQAVAMLPPSIVQDYRIMFQYFQEHGFLASEDALRRQQTLLDHPPRTYDAFVAEAVAMWR